MMRINPYFELVHIADDYMLIPVGEQMERFSGTVVLNDVSAFIFEQLKKEQTEEELVKSLMDEYEVDSDTAITHVHEALTKLKQLGIINE